MIVAVDPATAFQLFDVKPLQGKTSDLGPTSIAVYKNVATDKHLHLGDTVPVVFKDTGPQTAAGGADLRRQQRRAGRLLPGHARL